MFKRCLTVASPLIFTALLSACATGGSAEQHAALEFPQSWGGAPLDGQKISNADATANWWTLFGDSALNQLVDEALKNNADLSVAIARVDEARAQLGITAADQAPVVTGNLGHRRSRLSQVSGTPLPPGIDPLSNNNRATLDVSYEIDLWGRYRNASKAARADLLASEAARDTVRITLAAQVVQSYFALAGLDAQLAATRRMLEGRRETLKLQGLRLKAGVISEFELNQVEAELAATEAQLPDLARQRKQQQNALTLLLGRSPKAIVEGNIERATLANAQPVALLVPDGLPSDLLLRRPDLHEAEQRLAAANARIAAARAGYFPSISLTGYLGSESAALGDLFTGPARIWQFGANLLQPIFNADRVGYQVDAASARERQALAQYEQAIRNAFRDVQDALAAQTAAREILVATQRRSEVLTKTLSVAQLRYKNGISSQLDVLDTERNLLQAELSRIDAQRAQRAAIADMFKALGGGWSATGDGSVKPE